VTAERIHNLLVLIQTQELRLMRLKTHSAFTQFLAAETELQTALEQMQGFWQRFKSGVEAGEAGVVGYMDQLESSTKSLALDFDRLEEILGFSTTGRDPRLN
jgi:hypothetical protein